MGNGTRAGRRQVRGRVFIATEGTGDLRTPQYFAPSIESCNIVYNFRRTGSSRDVRLVIRGRDNTVVYENGLLGLRADGEYTLNWDGRDTGGNYITPSNSPYTVSLEAGGFRISKQVNVAVSTIAIWLQESPKILVNNPAHRILVIGTIFLRKTNGGQAATAISIEVHWTCIPGGSNTAHTGSYQVPGGRRLGKQGDASAVYWESHPDSAFAGSGLRCRATTVISGGDKGKSKMYFKPSGVGGDTFVLKASIFATDGTREIFHHESAELTIWRRVSLDAYEMSGQNHISTYGTNAIIAAYFTADTFVEYRLGRVHSIPSRFSVRYYGLWDHSLGRQANWAALQRKLPAETPTAAEIRSASGSLGAAQDAARSSIQAKANVWRNRIMAQYNAAIRDWAVDAGVPTNTAISAEYEHPKYSVNAPNADSITNEWSGLPWLSINVEGNNIHPDRRWVNGLGVESGQRAYTLAGDSVASTKVTIAHEAAHESKNQFQRADFGRGDHSSNPGLMDPTGSRTRFTTREKNTLRGKT